MKRGKRNSHFLAICKDRPDDPEGFVYTVYFVNDSASEISTLFYETVAFTTMDDEFVQTNTYKKDLGNVLPKSAIEIEQDDEESFEFSINFKFTLRAGAFRKDMTFSIPKYMRGLNETGHIPVLNKPGRVIYEGS